jgi:hypothetical protein
MPGFGCDTPCRPNASLEFALWKTDNRPRFQLLLRFGELPLGHAESANRKWICDRETIGMNNRCRTRDGLPRRTNAWRFANSGANDHRHRSACEDQQPARHRITPRPGLQL